MINKNILNIAIQKGSDTKFVNKNPVIIAVGIIIIFFAIAIATITTLQNLKFA